MADELERRRKQAVRAVAGGASRAAVATVLGVHSKTVARWVRASAKPGELDAKPQPGPPPGLTDADLRKLAGLLATGAKAHGWPDDYEPAADRGDPDPKALACYGLLRADTGGMLLRFVDGRLVSQVTEDFLGCVCDRLKAEGKAALLLVWDNASWHVSQRVRAWIREHNREVKRNGGARIVACFLPIKSPWLNAIEPKWVHGKRAIVEPDRVLSAQEVEARACDYYGCAARTPPADRSAQEKSRVTEKGCLNLR